MKNSKTDVLLAVLPLVDFKYQKQMAMAIKFMELDSILRHYDNVSIQSKSDANWRSNLIKALIPQMAQKNQQNMNQLLQIMEMQEMMQGMQNLEKNGGIAWTTPGQ